MIHSEDYKTPSTGHRDTAESDDERARKAKDKGEDVDRGAIPSAPERALRNGD